MKLTVPAAARRAGRSQETIRRWIWSGVSHLVDYDAECAAPSQSFSAATS
jgi:hypothetical protein